MYVRYRLKVWPKPFCIEKLFSKGNFVESLRLIRYLIIFNLILPVKQSNEIEIGKSNQGKL